MEDGGWTLRQFMFGMGIAFIGFLVVWKSDFLLRNFGRVPFAEKYLGSDGGTRLFYKLLGVLTMIGAIMHATGLLEPLGTWMLKTFFSSYNG